MVRQGNETSGAGSSSCFPCLRRLNHLELSVNLPHPTRYMVAGWTMIPEPATSLQALAMERGRGPDVRWRVLSPCAAVCGGSIPAVRAVRCRHAPDITDDYSYHLTRCRLSNERDAVRENGRCALRGQHRSSERQLSKRHHHFFRRLGGLRRRAAWQDFASRDTSSRNF